MNRTVAVLLVVASVVATGCIADQRAGGPNPPEGTTGTAETTSAAPPTDSPTTTRETTTPRTTTATGTTTTATGTTTTATRTTTTPGQTTTRRTTTADDPDGGVEGPFPPGVSGDGLVAPRRLFKVHLASLARSGYEMRFDARDTGTGITHAQVADDTDAVHVTLTAGDTTVEQYDAGDGTFQRTEFTARTGYAYFGPRVSPPIDDQYLVERAYVRLILLAGEFDLAGETTLDGQRVVKLRATGVADPSPLAGNVTLESLDATVLVDADGRIHRLRAAVAGTAADGGPLDGQLSYEVGAAQGVARPAWTDRVPRVEATLHDDGRVLEIEHAGGPPLSATATVRVGDRYDPLGEGIRPGESVHVWASGDADLSASRKRPSVGGDVPRLEERVQLTAVTSTTPYVRITVIATDDDE